MAVSVTMPQLGESVTEGTVTRWLKQEGETVAVDEPLLEVSTDKVDTEIPSPAAGVLARIAVQEDETVEVGAELAVIEDGAAAPAPQAAASAPGTAPEPTAAPEPAAPEPAAPEPAAPEPAAPELAAAPEPAAAEPAADPAPTPAAPTPAAPTLAPPAAEPPVGEESPTYVTPLVRKLAAEHGVDLAAVTGTGVGGRIRKQDVLDAAGAGAPSPAATALAATAPGAPAPAVPVGHDTQPSAPDPVISQAAPTAPSAPQAPVPVSAPVAAAAATTVKGRTEPLSRLRQVIATRMVESLQISAQLTTVVEADVTRIARLREQAKDGFAAREGVRLSFLPFFALATVEALKVHPVVNASVDTEAKTVTYHAAEHLGIAVDTPRGLLVPVLKDAGDLNLAGLARKIADLADRTRGNAVTPHELGGGTFTLTNTGSRGALFDTPIINQPQVGVLGTGSVVKRAVVVEDPAGGDVIAVRSMVYLALTYDHRIVDGADAARFLNTVKDRLETGDFAAELGL